MKIKLLFLALICMYTSDMHASSLMQQHLKDEFPEVSIKKIKMLTDFYSEVFKDFDDEQWRALKTENSIRIFMGDLKELNETEIAIQLNPEFQSNLLSFLPNYPGDDRAKEIAIRLENGIDMFEKEIISTIKNADFIALKKIANAGYFKEIRMLMDQMPSFSDNYIIVPSKIREIKKGLAHNEMTCRLNSHIDFISERSKIVANMLAMDVFSYSGQPDGNFATLEEFSLYVNELKNLYQGNIVIAGSIPNWQFKLNTYLYASFRNSATAKEIREAIIEELREMYDDYEDNPKSFYTSSKNEV